MEGGIEKNLVYMDLPNAHWLKIRMKNVIERLNREIRRRTRVVGEFPDGNSVRLPICARLRHNVNTTQSTKRYTGLKYLDDEGIAASNPVAG